MDCSHFRRPGVIEFCQFGECCCCARSPASQLGSLAASSSSSRLSLSRSVIIIKMNQLSLPDWLLGPRPSRPDLNLKLALLTREQRERPPLDRFIHEANSLPAGWKEIAGRSVRPSKWVAESNWVEWLKLGADWLGGERESQPIWWVMQMAAGRPAGQDADAISASERSARPAARCRPGPARPGPGRAGRAGGVWGRAA